MKIEYSTNDNINDKILYSLYIVTDEKSQTLTTNKLSNKYTYSTYSTHQNELDGVRFPVSLLRREKQKVRKNPN